MRFFIITITLAIFSSTYLPNNITSQDKTKYRLTDMMSESERRNSGLHKLTQDEIDNLNDWIMNTFISLSSLSANSLVFYDSKGNAVAYIDPNEDLTIYLWSGKPVGYLEDDNIYGFNGKHLGWLYNDAIYNHDGYVVAALSNIFSGGTKRLPPKGIKGFKPFKSFKQFEPYKPLFKLQWATSQL